MPRKKRVVKKRVVSKAHKRLKRHTKSHHPDMVHSSFVKFLMYMILFLIMALALLIFFSPTIVDFDGPVNGGDIIYEPVEPFLKINNAVCTWEEDSFNLCANVNWEGASDDYVKCGFGGMMEDKKMFSSPVTCCGDAGDEEGVSLVRAFLYNGNGEVYLDEGLSVTCTGKPKKEVTGLFPSSPEVYEKSFWFIAGPTGDMAMGGGVEYIDFPGRVKKCNVEGRWLTKGTSSEAHGAYCVGAEGEFYGNADLFGQDVFSDPDLFWWAGYSKHFIDPEGMVHEDEGFGETGFGFG